MVFTICSKSVQVMSQSRSRVRLEAIKSDASSGCESNVGVIGLLLGTSSGSGLQHSQCRTRTIDLLACLDIGPARGTPHSSLHRALDPPDESFQGPVQPGPQSQE